VPFKLSLEYNINVNSKGQNVERIEENSYVLIYHDNRRKWLVKPSETKRLHTHIGIIDVYSFVGMEYGSRTKTNTGAEIVFLKPTIEDIMMKFARRTQVIYPKDLSLIALKCSIHPGSKVIEAGTGSGAATAYLSYLVGKEGKVYTYEIRKEFQEIARKNLEKAGLGSNVTFFDEDIREGISVRDADAALIDIPDPWLAVEHIKNSVSKCGVSSFITPTYNQAEKLVEKMKEFNFVEIETVEIILRKLEVKMGATRPYSRMIGHTAYITFGRNL
jgi:tRNA (adenine57-N1/adenine58-N1)-methyltransferase